MLFVSAGFRFVCVVGLYLLGGFAYQRLVVGAKGFEQIPNYAFWVDFGNLQAVSAVRVTWAGGGGEWGGRGVRSTTLLSMPSSMVQVCVKCD